MADRARNQDGLGKAVTFNVITPMTRFGTCVVKLLLSFFDWYKSSQDTAKKLAFLPFVHWVVVERDEFYRLDDRPSPERLHYDYLFFLSTFNGPWGPYIEAFSDVLSKPLDLVWYWSIGYPFARPCNPLKRYIERNQVESDHCYSAYPGATVRDVRLALALGNELESFARGAANLSPDNFLSEFNRLLIRTENMLGTFGVTPD